MPTPDEMPKLVNEEDMELTDERSEVGSGGWSVCADGTCSERIDAMYPSKCDLTWPSCRAHEDAEQLRASTRPSTALKQSGLPKEAALALESVKREKALARG